MVDPVMRRGLGVWSRRALAIGVISVVVGALGVGSLPAGADDGVTSSTTPPTCSTVHLVVGNPQPGDLLFPGDYVVQGAAADSAAGQAPGIDRIQVFFDASREDGGRYIGAELAGVDSPGQHLAASGFALVARFPDTPAPNDTHALFVYARSAATGQEQIVSFQVQMKHSLTVGTALTPTPTPPPAGVSPVTCGTATPTPTFPPIPVALAGVTPGVSAGLTLRVFNPQSGDKLARGQYRIQGLAFDAAAQGGTGIEHVQVFLDPRDAGGQFLGTATVGLPGAGGAFGFELVAPLPARVGGHVLSIYARSAISGRETSVSIPITID